jgi:uncharacterized protein (TIGR02117 family)
MIKKASKIVGLSIGLFLSVVLFYLVISVVLSIIPVNKVNARNTGIPIYVISNGVHTELVLPIKQGSIDWSEKVRFENTAGRDTNMNYVAFGWGHKGFYLNTPHWSDLKFNIAFNSAFGLGESAMHVTFYHSASFGNNSIKIYLNQSQYLKLAHFISSSFKENELGAFEVINTDMVYGNNDTFYEGVGRFSMFKTCNTWTNSGLKACNQRACLWTPFDKGIFYQYKK